MAHFDVAVIGTVFTDIKGFTGNGYNPVGRNLGKAEITQGGVARNVAENLAKLDLSTLFVSSIDNNMLSGGVLSHLENCTINTDYVVKANENGMGIWLLLSDYQGNQLGSISQIPDAKHIENILNERGGEIFAGVDSIVLETDVSKATTLKTIELAEKYGTKVYALPSNMAVLMEIPEVLSHIEYFVCNHIEAGKLFNVNTDELSPTALIDVLNDAVKKCGTSKMVVTLGERGAVYFDNNTELQGYVPAMNVTPVDCSGAGDAFFSGSTAALIRGKALEDAVKSGTKLSALTIQHTSCNCDSDTIKNANILG